MYGSYILGLPLRTFYNPFLLPVPCKKIIHLELTVMEQNEEILGLSQDL